MNKKKEDLIALLRLHVSQLEADLKCVETDWARIVLESALEDTLKELEIAEKFDEWSDIQREIIVSRSVAREMLMRKR